jgi:hypothetical protein
MQTKMTLSVFVLSLLVWLPSQSMAGNITGTVIDKDGTPVDNIQVVFLDALNAELLATSFTGGSGSYNSGILPNGDYRIRFSDPGSHAPGFYVPEFFGASGADDFCSAGVSIVTSDSTAMIDESMQFSGPTLTVVRDFSFSGRARDAATLLPIPGIQVNFLNGVNGQQVTAVTTNADGLYKSGVKLFVDPTIRVRLTDPAVIYFPEFVGTSVPSNDDFCLGFEFPEGGHTGVNAKLDVIRVDPDDLIAVVEDLDLPGDVATMLATPLTRATALLTDDNPNNDAAVCRQLAAFLSRVDIQERKGQLTTAQADALRASTEIVTTEIGCP